MTLLQILNTTKPLKQDLTDAFIVLKRLCCNTKMTSEAVTKVNLIFFSLSLFVFEPLQIINKGSF